jgi:hypothetical protein
MDDYVKIEKLYYQITVVKFFFALKKTNQIAIFFSFFLSNI